MRTSFPTGQAGGGSGGDGGGLCSGGSTNQFVVSCTIAGNSPGYGGWGGTPEYPNPGFRGRGGGIASTSLARGAYLNNIIAGNTIGDVFGTFQSLGYNLIGVTNGNMDFVAPGDLTGSSAIPLAPKLAPLAGNGGPTITMALMSNSPAIDAGAFHSISMVDQRGVVRPQGRSVDIGAYEYQFSHSLITRVKLQHPFRLWLEACGMPNETYALQSSTDLTNWVNLIGLVTSSNGMCEAVALDINLAPARFYRLASPSP